MGGSSSNSSEPLEVPSDRKQLMKEVQRLLTEKGYNPGPIDGQAGPSTNSALSAFQTTNGLNLTNGVTDEAYIQLKSDSKRASSEITSQEDTRECVQNFTKQSGMRNYRTTASIDGIAKELALQRLVKVLSRKGFVINEQDSSRGYVNATYNAGKSDIQLSAFINPVNTGSSVELNYAGRGASFGVMFTPASAYRNELCEYIDAMQHGI
jgi:peptidoglycan hydrolase-like protein with peptidoglycan-binding domain